MQDVDLGEADLPHEVELEQERPGGIFLFDVGEDVVAVLRSLQVLQVLGVAAPLQLLHRRDVAFDHIEDQRNRREQSTVQLGEDGLPFALLAQVVQDSRSEDDVEGFRCQFDVPDIALDGTCALPCSASGARRPVEHGTAQINKGYVEAGQKL